MRFIAQEMQISTAQYLVLVESHVYRVRGVRFGMSTPFPLINGIHRVAKQYKLM